MLSSPERTLILKCSGRPHSRPVTSATWNGVCAARSAPSRTVPKVVSFWRIEPSSGRIRRPVSPDRVVPAALWIVGVSAIDVAGADEAVGRRVGVDLHRLGGDEGDRERVRLRDRPGEEAQRR